MAPDITGNHTDFQAQVKRLHIYLTHSGVEQSNNNHSAERNIGNTKKRFWQKMVSKKVPKRIWDYGLVNQAGILSRIDCGKAVQTGIEEVTG